MMRRLALAMATAGILAAAGPSPRAETSTPSIEERLSQCGEEADGARRLACYDQIAKTLRIPHPVNSVPAPSAAVASVPAPSASVASAPVASAPAPSAPAPSAPAPSAPAPSSPAPSAAQAAAPVVPAANRPSTPTATANDAGSADFGVSNGPLQAKQSATKPKSLSASVVGVSTRPRGELAVTLDNGQVWVQIQASSNFAVKAGDKVEIDVGALGSYVMWVPSIRRASKVTRVY